jgi:hypothetical protein
MSLDAVQQVAVPPSTGSSEPAAAGSSGADKPAAQGTPPGVSADKSSGPEALQAVLQSADKAIAAFGLKLGLTLGPAASHVERVLNAAKVFAQLAEAGQKDGSLKGEADKFLQTLSQIGKSFGLNFGLSERAGDGAGPGKALNADAFAGVDKANNAHYAQNQALLNDYLAQKGEQATPAAPAAPDTPADQAAPAGGQPPADAVIDAAKSISQTFLTKADANQDGRIAPDELTQIAQRQDATPEDKSIAALLLQQLPQGQDVPAQALLEPLANAIAPALAANASSAAQRPAQP